MARLVAWMPPRQSSARSEPQDALKNRSRSTSPAGPLAVAVIVLELGASALILTGFWRWLGALALAGFTLMATFVALRFWGMAPGPERFMAANSFFEHLGLAGGFLLVAWHDLRERNAHG